MPIKLAVESDCVKRIILAQDLNCDNFLDSWNVTKLEILLQTLQERCGYQRNLSLSDIHNKFVRINLSALHKSARDEKEILLPDNLNGD